jgi:hypothetical protein
MPNWKNVDFIQPKWNSLVTLFMEMVCTWIFVRFKLLWTRLPQLLFMMFNVFVGLQIFIDVSLHTIPQ